MFTRIAVVIALFLVLLFVIQQAYKEENFENKDVKAQSIYDWFTKNSTHTYDSFRKHTKLDSNIVEYEDVKKLFADKNLTIPNIKRVI